MTGLEQAKAFYEEYGREMLHEKFPEAEGRIAVGLAGHGSECFGFDDEISRDHDFEIGFCMWISDEDDLDMGVELAREYRKLPVIRAENKSIMGEKKVGVRRISDFYRRYTGSAGAPKDWRQWMSIPSYALAEATNGQVWRDDAGEFSRIRDELLHGMPEDVRKKKLAARVISMAQAGQYNFSRCVKHGENGAAMMALGEFVRSAVDAIFLLNRAHMPYYKWMFRAMDALEILSDIKEPLEYLLTGENGEDGIRLKAQLIEDICANVALELKNQQLTHSSRDFLEMHAYEIMEHIENPEIRALHVMEG